MAARLVPLEEGPTIVIDRPILFLGRDPECDIQIDSRKVSRRHCCIVQLEDHLIIRDLGSTNGLRLNGQSVEEAELKPKDEIRIGHLSYRVDVEEAKESPTSATQAEA